MSTKAKGDLLEKLILLVERSLANQPGTILRRGHKISDEHGVERALDVYVEAKVNGKTHKYAFECKNHKRGIAISDITAFHAMIHNTGIKGYFVTSGTYQAGAIKKATAMGIDLMTLTARAAGPDDIKGVFIFRKQFIIKGMQPWGFCETLDEAGVVEMFSTCEKCRNAVVEVLNEQVTKLMDTLIDPAVESVAPEFRNLKELHSTFGRENAKALKCVAVFGPGTTITHAQQHKVHFSHVLVDFEVWNEKILAQDVDAEHFVYASYDDQGSGTLFSKAEFVLDNKQMVLGITKQPLGNRQMVVEQEKNIPSTQPEQVFSLGNIDELGMKKFFEQDDKPSADC